MRTLLALVALIFAPAVASAQVGYALNFLTVPSSSRSLGLAGAGSTVLDPTMAPLNPATIGPLAPDGSVGIIRNTHDQPDDVRYGAKHSNTFLVAGLSTGNRTSTHRLNYSLGIAYHRQYADWGMIQRSGELGQPEEPIHIYDRSNNLTISGCVSRGIQASVGVTVKDYRSVMGTAAIADGILADYGFLVRIPILDLAESLTGANQRAERDYEFGLIAAIGHVWANRGSDVEYLAAQEPDPPPRLRRLGLSGEGYITYQSARIIGIVACRDEERFTDELINHEVLVRKGLELDILGILRIQDGSYESPFGGEDDASGFAVHLNGLWRWLSILDAGSRRSTISHWIDRLDVYYQDSELSGVPDIESGGLGYNEFGVTLRLSGGEDF